ncbi:uncharacterized protein LOC112350950 [Selaginella moellendorffii]|uniref:uncharacterized protein LOC112345017 n=1 Tax=Selaginella moellendorffii TaxID=88036 RepID=UPI000D1C5673|nr:uncharacterized protein LOC112345017 [Selaginella moellendorffii]XP_024543784.1 uncharacterized protein LOC112350950 [Selaginella moellendorffii]|eukprot:XP_024526657.1 uncharacterized protein LOC112345017 [Selaginella moellendorffii]
MATKAIAAMALGSLSPSLRSNAPIAMASMAEPKWKQKVAAAEENIERIKRETLQAQEEYKRRQLQTQGRELASSKELVSLEDLEFLPYLTEDGMILDCSQADAKASVYAVFDENKVINYIGISRQIHPSMRLHFARVPQKCYFVKVYHVTKPSRSILELTRNKWMAESPVPPPGNTDSEQQNIWENPLDCKPLMTDEEIKLHEEAGQGPPKAKVLKNVARRIEKSLVASFDSRNCKETLRFDPKLKEQGLLDLKNEPKKPDTSIPSTKLK